MNKNQTILLIVSINTAACTALITSRLYNDRLRTLQSKIEADRLAYNAVVKAFVKASKNMSGPEFASILMESINDVHFENIVKDFDKK
ncbi:hypothetical protein PBI_INGRID_36 [Arthrobacter phage Ingrid]|nr:hypothetical protein PBI_INGRID_36 [Arthrobacter phage Ingrid]QFG11018.1 hypothetical protein PBI_LORETTA_36 [Arthrobacter phage Loretta]